MWFVRFDHSDHDLPALNIKLVGHNNDEILCFSSPAPPLTLANVLDAVKNVRSWRTLGQHIFSFKLDAVLVQQRHVSDKARLKDVVELFLSGKGHYKQPSWRALIWSLYKANETQLADNIRSYAEPVQGRCGELHMHDSDLYILVLGLHVCYTIIQCHVC